MTNIEFHEIVSSITKSGKIIIPLFSGILTIQISSNHRNDTKNIKKGIIEFSYRGLTSENTSYIFPVTTKNETKKNISSKIEKGIKYISDEIQKYKKDYILDIKENHKKLLEIEKIFHHVMKENMRKISTYNTEENVREYFDKVFNTDVDTLESTDNLYDASKPINLIYNNNEFYNSCKFDLTRDGNNVVVGLELKRIVVNEKNINTLNEIMSLYKKLVTKEEKK